MMTSAVPVAQSGISAIERTANVPVIGWSRKKIRHNKKQDVITEESIQVRAWELAAIGVAASLLIYLTGSIPGLPGSSSGSSPGSSNVRTGGPGLFNIGGYSFGGLSYL